MTAIIRGARVSRPLSDLFDAGETAALRRFRVDWDY